MYFHNRLLEEAFLDQIKEVVKSCAPTRQTLLFSATMTDQVNELAAMSLRRPVKIFVDSNRAVAWNLQQEFVRIRACHEKSQEAVLASLLARTCRYHNRRLFQRQNNLAFFVYQLRVCGSCYDFSHHFF